MTNSTKTDDWIASVIAANPIHLDPSGNVITCPVRLTYCDIFEPAKPQRGEVVDPTKPAKYGAAILFPPAAIHQIRTVIDPVLKNAAKAAHSRFYDAATDSFAGLNFPLRDQAEKLDQEGFTRLGLWVRVTSRYQPQVVDPMMRPVTDPKRVYNGVWAICALNVYTYDDPRKKGVSLGLNMVMLFSDDTRLVSKAASPAAAFAGVKIDQAFDPSHAFNGSTAGAPDAREFL
jgi:hypothetical protein